MKFFIKDFLSKCDQMYRKLRIWSHFLKNSLMENFIFCAVFGIKGPKKAMKYAFYVNVDVSMIHELLFYFIFIASDFIHL